MTTLTKAQQSDFRACEATITKGLATFRDVGQALARIREERLYQASHKTFEAYCQERWNFSSSRARQLIGAAKVAESVTTGNTSEPAAEPIQNERQARRVAAEANAAADPEPEPDTDEWPDAAEPEPELLDPEPADLYEDPDQERERVLTLFRTTIEAEQIDLQWTLAQWRSLLDQAVDEALK